MVIVSVSELRRILPPGRRLLGLDVGTKTIGIAVADASLTVATPVTTLHRTRFADDTAHLGRIVAEHEVGGLVIGLPISMDGTEGPRCRSVRQFAANLLKVIDLPVAFWDERLSTAAVERMLIHEADLSRARRRKVVDRAAAAYILQGALDASASAGSRDPS